MQFDYTPKEESGVPLEEVKEPVDTGPRPWNEPRIPMAEPTKSNKQKIDEAISQMKVRQSRIPNFVELV